MWHMEVPRLDTESELQLLAYTTARAMWDLSRICHLHHSPQQCWIPTPLSANPLTKARDRTCILMDMSQICFRWATTRTPRKSSINSCWVGILWGKGKRIRPRLGPLFVFRFSYLSVGKSIQKMSFLILEILKKDKKDLDFFFSWLLSQDPT